MTTESARPLLLPLAAALATFAVQLLHIGFAHWGWDLLSAYPQSDAYYYMHKAWFSAFVSADGGELQKFLPLSPYVTLLSWAYRLFGAEAIVPLLVNAALLSTCAVCCALATRCLFGEAAGWFAAMLIALCGPLTFFAGLTVKTNLEVALLAASMYAAVCYFEQPCWHRALWPAALGALLAIERNNMAVMLVALAVAVVLQRRRFDATTNGSLAAIAVAVIGVAAVSAWEPARIEQKFFSPVGVNFHVGNAPDSQGSYTHVKEIRNDLVGHQTSARRVAEEHAGRELARGEVSAYWFDRSLQFIRGEPLAYAELQMKKLGLLLAHAGHGAPEEYRVWRTARPALWVACVDYGLVLALFVVGVWAVRKRSADPSVCFLLLTAALYALTVWMFYVHERYRMPLLIIMVPFAAFALADTWQRRTPRLLALRSAAAAAIYGGSIALALTVPAQSGWSLDLPQAREKEMRRLERQQATYKLRLQLVSAPRTDGLIALSKDLYARGLPRDGITIARLAVDQAPGDVAACWNMFTLAVRQKDQESLRALDQSIASVTSTDAYVTRRLRELRGEINRRLIVMR